MKAINTFKNSKKIVIKVGSSLLTNRKGNVNKYVLKNVVNDISSLLKKNKEIILVSSGAISLGKGKLKLNKKLSLNESQAVAATGKFHARGPVGIDQLTSFKYLVNGNGHIRP